MLFANVCREVLIGRHKYRAPSSQNYLMIITDQNTAQTSMINGMVALRFFFFVNSYFLMYKCGTLFEVAIYIPQLSLLMFHVSHGNGTSSRRNSLTYIHQIPLIRTSLLMKSKPIGMG